MYDSPRTDAEARTEIKRGPNSMYEVQIVAASFARKLERELAIQKQLALELASKVLLAEIKRDELREKLAACEIQNMRWQACFDAAIKRLSNIYSFMSPPDVEMDGKRFSYRPPDDLLYETWRRLSESIRNLPNEIAAISERGKDDRWKRCPSMHCERRQECASPSDCTVKERWSKT